MTGFRRARPEDAATVTAFSEAEGLSRPCNPPAADVAQPAHPAQAALLVARNAAWVAARVAVGDDGWACYLGLRSDLRERGRATMTATEVWARSRGAVRLQLMARESNGRALRFYERPGHAESDVRVMERRLDPARERLAAPAHADVR